MGRIIRRTLYAQVERYTAAEADLQAVYPQHWQELALNKDQIPLDPDYEAYRTLDAAGCVLLVTLRDRDKLAGYFIGFLFPELHYRTCKSCFSDIFYVLPEYRTGASGVRLFRKVEAELRSRGVKRWHVTSKLHKDSGVLLRRLGFTEVEAHYSKVL